MRSSQSARRVIVAGVNDCPMLGSKTFYSFEEISMSLQLEVMRTVRIDGVLVADVP